MYKYEEEIEERIKNYHWRETCDFFTDENGEISQVALNAVFQDFRRPLLSNARRALDAYYTYDREGVHRTSNPGENWWHLPVMEMPCADYNNIPDNFSGLYFIGMIGTNPDGKKYFLVKVGCSGDVKDRIRQYASYNPMIYIGGIVPGVGETNCHNYIAERAIALAQHANEWFYVDEDTYFELCETFSDKEQFQAIAEGRD